MVNQKYSIAIAETLFYLKGINQKDIEKIPKNFIKFLNENASSNYICDFDYTKPLNELNLTKEAKGLISMICLNYWCETEEQKTHFKNKLDENEIKYQEELKKKYNPDTMFKKVDITKDINFKEKENLKMTEYQEPKWYCKIFFSILKIFKKR